MSRPPARPRRRRLHAFLAVVLALAAAGVGGAVLRQRVQASRAEREQAWNRINQAVAQQRWPEVETLLRAWLDGSPGDGRARLMLGHLLASSRRPEEAATVLAAVGERDPLWPDARVMVGELALAESDLPRAEGIFRQVADAVPEAIEPRRRLIYLLALQLRTAEVRERLWELYRTTKDPRVLVDLVLEATKSEVDVRGIGPEVERFLAATPTDPHLRRVRGLALLWSGRPTEALPHLEAAAGGLADDPLGRFALAECRLQLGRPFEVPEILGPCPAPPADAARWWVFRARLESAVGRDDEAIASLRRAIEIDPEFEEAHHRLARDLAARGEPEAESAAEHARAAEAIRQGWAELRREFTRLREAGHAPDPALYERLGDLCRGRALDDEARAWYEQARALDPNRESTIRALAALAKSTASMPVPLSRPRRVEAGAGAPAPALARAGEPAAAPRPAIRFEDVAGSASGIDFRYDHGPRADLYLADTMGGGVGLIDYDDDGRLDIYFVNGCPMPYDRSAPPRPNRLYRNNGAGAFEDVTEAAGVGGYGYGMGCVVGDYDDDGHDDLFVTGFDRTVLYRNNGDGTFEDVTEAAGVGSDRWTTAAAFGDLDGDGDLDLFVVTYVEDDPAEPRPCRDHAGQPIHCSPGHYPAQQDLLFRNDGGGTFTDVSVEAGVEAPSGRGLGVAIADLDGDGRLDVYVANDASADFVFRNLGDLRFEEVGALTGLALDGAGKATASMGVVADDLNGDGLIDLLHTNFLNEANTLHENLGGGMFADATMSAGLAAPSLATTGFGAAALDVDNDGLLDLFLANGHVDDQPWANSPIAQPPQLFLARGGGRFELVPPGAFPYLGRRVVGRGLAAGDLDDDGRVDLVVVHRGEPASVLMNRTEAGGGWLGIRLRGKASGATPVGARVTVEAGGRTQTRWLTSGTSYLSAHDPRLWFGLGDAANVDRLEVAWPSGATQIWNNLAPGRVLEIVEGDDPHEATQETDPGPTHS